MRLLAALCFAFLAACGGGDDRPLIPAGTELVNGKITTEDQYVGQPIIVTGEQRQMRRKGDRRLQTTTPPPPGDWVVFPMNDGSYVFYDRATGRFLAQSWRVDHAPGPECQNQCLGILRYSVEFGWQWMVFRGNDIIWWDGADVMVIHFNDQDSDMFDWLIDHFEGPPRAPLSEHPGYISVNCLTSACWMVNRIAPVPTSWISAPQYLWQYRMTTIPW